MVESSRGSWTSASAAAFDRACPGRHLAQQGIPEPPYDNDQAFGNLVHKALADSSDTATLNSLNVKQRDLFDSCRAIEKKVVLDYFGVDHPPMRVYREERKWIRFVPPSGYTGQVLSHSGCADAFYLAGAKGLVIDYKSLSGEVADASSNEQIRDNIALWRGYIMSMKGVLVECGGCIIQPYVTHSPVVVNYTEPEIDRANQEMMERVAKSNDPKSPRIAGELQCKFCRAKATCRQYQTWATATLPSFRDIMSLSPEHWTPEQRTIFMDRLPIAQQWLDETKKFMEDYCSITPDFVPGYALTDGVVKRPITDLKTLLDRIVSVGGTAAGLLTEAGTVSKKDLEIYFKKLIKAKVKGSVAQNIEFEKLCEKICTAKPNKPTLKKL